MWQGHKICKLKKKKARSSSETYINKKIEDNPYLSPTLLQFYFLHRKKLETNLLWLLDPMEAAEVRRGCRRSW